MRSGLNRFTVDDEVFTLRYPFVLVTIQLQSASLGVKGHTLLDLLPAGDARISAEHDQGGAAIVHDCFDLVAAKGIAGVENPLHVDIDAIFIDEAIVLLETFVASKAGKGLGNSGVDFDVVASVVDSFYTALGEELEERAYEEMEAEGIPREQVRPCRGRLRLSSACPAAPCGTPQGPRCSLSLCTIEALHGL